MTIPPRPPEQVMRLARMGSFHQHRLSFMRILLRRIKADGWTFSRPRFDFDARGVGVGLYVAQGPMRAYTLVAFGHDLPPDMRSDRVIATAWDATFSLFDGIPTAADVERLRQNVPLQEAGRVSGAELTVSRANRSVRLWDQVVDRLAAGQQPDGEMLTDVGYLMRTTAVYGSGKLGAADREVIADRIECAPPFQMEMLTVFLIRAFVADLVEHMARAKGGDTAVPLAADLRRRLGIGNSTGLGMAPFLVTHPVLLNNWIAAREEALAVVRRLPSADPGDVAKFRALVGRASRNIDDWRSVHPLQVEKLQTLRRDMAALQDHLATADLGGNAPWDSLYRWAESALGLDAQELLVSLLMEPYGALIDGFACCMSADEGAAFTLDGAMPVGMLRQILGQVYGWALTTDWGDRAAQARVWYVSVEKLEPRMGERFDEPIAAYEQPLSPGREAARLHADLANWADDAPVGDLLLAHPDHRHTVRRAQIAARYPYAEIRDNTIAADVLPIDMLRAKLAFFGAQHFDPRSDRWVRINMFRGAPYPGELADADPDDWTYPA